MSAELLRRAAAKLREHAQAVADADVLADGTPWTVEEEETGELYVIADFTEFSTVYIAEGFISRAHADFVALLHPPVALALADLIEVGIGYAAVNKPETFPVYVKAVAAARAVLREPEETS